MKVSELVERLRCRPLYGMVLTSGVSALVNKFQLDDCYMISRGCRWINLSLSSHPDACGGETRSTSKPCEYGACVILGLDFVECWRPLQIPVFICRKYRIDILSIYQYCIFIHIRCTECLPSCVVLPTRMHIMCGNLILIYIYIYIYCLYSGSRLIA